MSDRHERIQALADNNAQALETAAAALNAARAEKANLARQLSARQEELRHIGLLSPRRSLLKSELNRLTAAYTAASRQVEALTARQSTVQEEADRRMKELEARLAEEEAIPAAEAPAPVKKAPAVPRVPRARVSAGSAAQRTELLLHRLEAFYPEHQVYALDSISSELRLQLAALTRQTGHGSIADFLAEQGWRCIRGEAVLALRRGKHCTPGEEPAVIRPKVESALRRLAACYPDKVIPRSIQRDHKSLSQDLTGLYQWLGYEDMTAMLSAYGYRYEADPRGGRPATDAAAVLEAVRAAYAGRKKPASVQQVMQDFPALAAALKTLQNRAPRLFGMTLRQKMQEEGIL